MVESVEEYAIYLMDEAGHIQSWNRGAELIKGYPKQQILGRHHSVFYRQEDIAAGQPTQALEQAGLRRKLEAEGLRVRQDGSLFYANVLITALYDESGRVSGFINVTRDITARREAEAQQLQLREVLARAATEWRRTFDAVGLPMVVLDSTGRIVRLNRTAQALTGRGFDELMGQRLEGLGQKMPWPQAAALLEKTLREGQGGSTQIYDALAQTAWEISVQWDERPQPEEARFILVMKDISRLMVLQDLLRQSEALSLLGQLMAGVAHEVRNPLFGITSTLDALEARLGAEGPYARHLGVLRQKVEQLTELMSDLLSYGRPASSEHLPHELGPVLEEAASACAVLAHSRGVKVDVRTAPRLPRVRMEPSRLVQAFQNLLSNAVYYSPQGGTVTLSAERRGLWLECVVADEGPGFLVDDLPRLFEPFFTRREGGVGLGLPIVQRIMQQHQGRVCAGNGPTGGARIVVRLPVGMDDERQDPVGG